MFTFTKSLLFVVKSPVNAKTTPKVTVILTAWKEARTIPRAIISLIDPAYSGFNGSLQLIQISPDNKTLDAGKKAVKALKKVKKEAFAKPKLPVFTRMETENFEFVQIKDPRKGKPHALNLAFKYITGDIVVFTDGDVYFSEGALQRLIQPLISEQSASKRDAAESPLGGVTGRPLAQNPRDGSFMDFMANAFVYVADLYRKDISEYQDSGYYLNDFSKGFVTLSGYIYALRKEVIDTGLKLPRKALIDDAYISAFAVSKGFGLGYVPEATVNVKYPSTFHDYLIQRVRNIKGQRQIKELIPLEFEPTRNIFDEIRYALFPFKFINWSRPREILYAAALYPLRIITWIAVILMTSRFTHIARGGWKRVESTK